MGGELFTGFRAADWALLAVAPMVGSFVGVIIRRVPEGLPVTWSRSRCEHCGAKLSPRDLVPLISWLVGRGRCRHCDSSLGWFYPGSEGAVVAIAVISLIVDRGADAWLDSSAGLLAPGARLDRFAPVDIAGCAYPAADRSGHWRCLVAGSVGIKGSDSRYHMRLSCAADGRLGLPQGSRERGARRRRC